MDNFKIIPLGKWEKLSEGTDIAILAVGKMVAEAQIAAEYLSLNGISAEVINARFIKPLDYNMLDEVFLKFDKIITVEEGQISGGFGSAVMEYYAEKKIKYAEVFIHGIPDRYIEHGTQEQLLSELKLNATGITEIAKTMLEAEVLY